jgi:hypothetical protein
MRPALLAHVDCGGQHLDPLVAKALLGFAGARARSRRQSQVRNRLANWRATQAKNLGACVDKGPGSCEHPDIQVLEWLF